MSNPGGRVSKGGPRNNQPRPPLTSAALGTTAREVLRLLSEGKTLKAIARDLGVHKSTVQEHAKKMRGLGLTHSEDYLWSVTKLGKDYLGGRVGLEVSERGGAGATAWLHQDRAHNIKVKVRVVEKPPDDSWLRGWKPNREIKNNVFYTQRFGEIVTMFTGRSLVFQLPVLYFRDADSALVEAGKIAQALMVKYEREVVGLRLGDYDVKAQLITQHHAIPYEPFAKWLHQHGISYRDDLIDIDSSKTPELEFIDPVYSHQHHANYVRVVKDFARQEVPTISELSKVLLQQMKTSVEIAAGLNVVVGAWKASAKSQGLVRDDDWSEADYFG